ncbi:ABC transporter substrate-binding protein [Agrobacterium sp. 22-222-1]
MTKLSRRDFTKIFASASLGAAFLGTTMAEAAVTSGADGKPAAGGTLRIVTASEQPSFVDLFGNGATAAVQGELISIDSDLNPRPSAAESWDVSEDGKSYTFHLRPGVKWHDGKPFTSADVAFSILTLKEVHPRRKNTFANVTAVETPDPLTAIVRLSAPAPYLLGALSGAGTALVAKHLYEGTDLKTNPYNRKPVGIGPFIFKEWEQGSHFVLERNPNYWDQGKPYLDQIIVRIIPDSAARAAALEAGEVDFGTGSPVPYSDVERFVATGKFAVDTKGYELGGNLHQLFFNLDNAFLKKLKVRQAIAHSFDINQIIKLVWNGYATPAATAIVPDLKQFHDASLKHYTYDPDLAETLLDEAGFPRGADGTRAKLNLTWNPGMAQQKLAADYIRFALGKVGISVNILSFEFSTYITKVYTERVFDIDVQNLNNGYDPTDGVDRAFLSTNIKKGLAWSNHMHYSNPEVDALLTEAAGEPDAAKRRDKYVKFQEIIHRDLPVVNFVQFQRITLFNTKVHDHTTAAARVGADYFDRTWITG